MADDLRDLSVEALDHKTVSLGERVRAFEVERPTDPPLPADLDAAHDRAVACDGELGALRDRVARLESDEAEASRALQELRLDEAGAKANLDQARELERREFGSLDAARRVASDDEVARGLGEAEAALQARADALARAEEELGAEHPDTVETRLGNTRDALKRLAAELHDNDTQVRALRTRLEVKGDEGLARQLVASRGRPSLSQELDYDFFEALVQITGNRPLLLFSNVVRAVYLRGRQRFLSLYAKEVFDPRHHERAVAAIRARDAVAAGAAMRAHATTALAAAGDRR